MTLDSPSLEVHHHEASPGESEPSNERADMVSQADRGRTVRRQTGGAESDTGSKRDITNDIGNPDPN